MIHIATHRVRKLRWTYSADLQDQAFARSEFSVVVSNWTVSGSGRSYSIAGPGSRRIEDDNRNLTYSGIWTKSTGNFSGGSVHLTHAAGSTLRTEYKASQTHTLYLGTRLVPNGASVMVTVDGTLALADNQLTRYSRPSISPASWTTTICG